MTESFEQYVANRSPREKLQEEYITRIIDGLDWGDLWQLASERLEEQLDELDDEQLTNEIKEYYPDLLENQ